MAVWLPCLQGRHKTQRDRELHGLWQPGPHFSPQFQVRTHPDHPEVVDVVRRAIELLPGAVWVEDVEPDPPFEDDPSLTAASDQGQVKGTSAGYGDEISDGGYFFVNDILRAQIINLGTTPKLPPA